MSLQEFSTGRPAGYQGLEDFLPKEMNGFVFELIRRLTINDEALITSLQNQVIVDPDVVQDDEDNSVSTTLDLEASEMETNILNF